jgi:hypothetical protein
MGFVSIIDLINSDLIKIKNSVKIKSSTTELLIYNQNLFFNKLGT